MKPVPLLLALLLAPLAALNAAEPPARPNILHIHADDHRSDGARALGNPLLVTPNIDALAERGMIFTHCYTMGSMVGAVCTPTRTMMLTGRSWQRIPGDAGDRHSRRRTRRSFRAGRAAPQCHLHRRRRSRLRAAATGGGWSSK